MESIGLDLDEIFEPTGRYESDEDVGHVHQSQEQEQQDSAKDDEVLNRLKDLSKGASKKKVSRPQLKLDVDRLKSSRGLPALPKVFDKIKFKGRGYEMEDLELIMSTLEHWGHRLMPKMPFHELVEKLEKLGGKKEVQTCIKRVRLDLPFFDGEIIEDEEVNDGTPNVFLFDDIHNDTPQTNQIFNVFNDQDVTVSPATPVVPAVNTSNSTLTPSQRERIERNKQLALQKRLERSALGTPQPSFT